MQINVTYDASATGAPAGFQQAVQAAVNALDSVITNNITVNIAFGWGEVNSQLMAAGALGESIANFDNLSYSQVQTLFAAAPVTPAVSASMAALPSSFSLGAAFWLATAEAKALGYTAASPTEDGYVGLDSSSAFTFDPDNRAVPGKYDAIGILEHEITEVLGREIMGGVGHGYTPFDLFRYGGSDTLLDTSFTGGSFGFNGHPPLAQFNSNSDGDPGDWAGTGIPDSFDAFATAGAVGSLSAVDLRVLQALGYDISDSAASSASAPVTIQQDGALAAGATQTFNGADALLYSHAVSQGAITYTNAGTISNNGTLSLDVVGVGTDPSSGQQSPSGADL